jgi:glycosyltransferase involved in cell wall biosynthesis
VRGEAKVLYLGRLTGGRWRALEFFFSALKRFGKSLPQTRFVVVGRIPEERAALMKRHLSEVNQAIAPSVVETHDFVGNLAPLIGEAYGVIGAGRSALESLALGKPVIALGEKAVIGLCEEESWPEVMRTNFGDHIAGENQFYPAHLEFGLRKMLDPNTVPPGTWGRAQVERYYNIATVARQIETLYKEAFT